MTDPADQLAAISAIAASFGADGIDYWVFGGWAVDLHAGRITRPHDDIDVVVWTSDRDRASTALTRDGWQREPDGAADGYLPFRLGAVRLELAFADRANHPEWPPDAFGTDIGRVGDVTARVTSRAALIADKSADYGNATTAAKDEADVAILRAGDS